MKRVQVVKIFGAKLTFSDPGNGLNVSQAAWRGFDVGFKRIVDILVFVMPGNLLIPFGAKKFFGWPDALTRSEPFHFVSELRRACQCSGFHQRGRDCDIRFGLNEFSLKRKYSTATLAEIPLTDCASATPDVSKVGVVVGELIRVWRRSSTLGVFCRDYPDLLRAFRVKSFCKSLVSRALHKFVRRAHLSRRDVQMLIRMLDHEYHSGEVEL